MGKRKQRISDAIRGPLAEEKYSREAFDAFEREADDLLKCVAGRNLYAAAECMRATNPHPSAEAVCLALRRQNQLNATRRRSDRPPRRVVGSLSDLIVQTGYLPAAEFKKKHKVWWSAAVRRLDSQVKVRRWYTSELSRTRKKHQITVR